MNTAPYIMHSIGVSSVDERLSMTQLAVYMYIYIHEYIYIYTYVLYMERVERGEREDHYHVLW